MTGLLAPLRGDPRGVLKEVFAEFKRDDVPSLAAGVAFRIVLSIVPSLIAGIAIAAAVIEADDVARLIDRAAAALPGDAVAFLRNQVDNVLADLASGGVAVTGIAVGVFAATTAALALVKALNRAWDVEEGRSFLVQRGTALAITVALLVAIVAMFVVLVLGPQIVRALLPDSLEGGPLPLLLGVARLLGAVAVLVLFFSFTFWVGPHRDRPRWRWVSPGAATGVFGWLLLSYLFSLYARNFGNYNATYGALAGIVVFMVWLNLSFIVLLLGAEMDAVLEQRLERAPHPPAEVPAAASLTSPAAGAAPAATRRGVAPVARGLFALAVAGLAVRLLARATGQR